MNINQALRRVSVIKGELSSWTTRLKSSIAWIDQKSPTWTYDECVKNVSDLTTELIDIESRIAFANSKAKINWNNETITLAKAIRTLAQLKGSIELYKSFASFNDKESILVEEEQKYDLATRAYISVNKETKRFCSITERERVEKIKSLQESFDKLNELVEGQNHQVKI
jgi:hypothetical protein